MRTAIITKQGKPEFIQIKEIPKPIPKENEILVKVCATTVTAGDIIMRKAGFFMLLILRLFGLKKKIIPGTEFAGIIESVGTKVMQFKAGDEIFGTTTGLSIGGASEYICLPETWKHGVFTIKPANLSFEEAAASVVGCMTALLLLSKISIQKGTKILIYGASGSVGTFAVQLAKHLGAEVTGVSSTKNLELLQSLGADKVLDYTQEGFEKNIEDKSFEVVFDAVGKLKTGKNAVKKADEYISVKSLTKETLETLEEIRNMLEKGKLKPVIDKTFTLDNIVEAHEYVEKGHKKGNVVILID